jgi:hypothetical protein
VAAATLEYQANKNAASGYAGLTAGTKLTTAQGQEVWACADLTDSGSLCASSGPLAQSEAGASNNFLTAYNSTTGAFSKAQPTWANIDKTTSSLGDLATRASTNLSDSSALVRNNAGNTWSTGAQDFGSGTSLKVPTSAGAAPTASGLIAYDSTANAFKGGVNSSTKTFAFLDSNITGTAAGLSATLALATGGTNQTSWTASRCVQVNAGGTALESAAAACGSGGGGITTLNTLTAAVQAFATPGTSGTAPNWSSVTDAHTLNIPLAATASVTAGLISQTEYDTFNAKPSLVGAGTNGTAAYNAGDDTTAARSDHTHRSIHNLTWYFPGTPATGVQNMQLTIPEGVTNIALADLRVTATTFSSGSSTFNIQRCVVSSVACSVTQSTWVDIYSAVLTLAASNYSVTKGSAPNQNVDSLVAGDRFRASLVTIGTSLADVTVTLTVKYETTN